MAHTCKLSFDANIGIGVTGTTSNLDPNNSDSIMGIIYYSIQSDDITIDAKLNNP